MLAPRGTPLRIFMLVVAPLLAVTVVAVATFAQSPAKPAGKIPANTLADRSEAPQMESQIRQNLSSQGFSDIEITPASYLVAAKDKEGNSFLILVAPDQTTVLAMERSALDNDLGDDSRDSGPSIAEPPGRNSDKLIFQ